MASANRTCARLGYGLLVVAALGASGRASATTIDDTTTVTYAVPAGPRGGFADFPVVRTFDAEIRSIRVEIIGGRADDIGYVGALRVTDIKPACADIGTVLGPIDVTSQVTVTGNTASFVLRAQENCCCVTGWGPATQSDRAPARFRWHVELADACDPAQPETCGACESTAELSANASFEYAIDATTACPANLGGGKVGLEVALEASGSLTAASCLDECQGSLTLGGTATGTASSCGLLSQAVSGGFQYAEDRQYGTTCNPDTCLQECDFSKSCIESEATGTIGLTTTRTFTQNYLLRPPGTRGAFVSARCGVDVSVSHQLEFGTSTHFPAGLDPCPRCDQQSLAYTLGGRGVGRCLIELRALGRRFDFGCDDCVELSVEAQLEGSLDRGPDCTAGGCLGATVTAAGTLQAPDRCLSLFGYMVETHISASATGTCTANTCTGNDCDLSIAGAVDFDTGVGTCD